jgi:hypothetical protein
MPIDPGVALASIFTAAGAPIWGGIIQGLIQVLKGIPQFKPLVDGREKLICFILAGLLVVAAFASAMSATPPAMSLDVVGIVAAILCWFTVGRIAMALFDDLIAKETVTTDGKVTTRPTESVLSTQGWTGK